MCWSSRISGLSAKDGKSGRETVSRAGMDGSGELPGRLVFLWRLPSFQQEEHEVALRGLGSSCLS